MSEETPGAAPSAPPHPDDPLAGGAPAAAAAAAEAPAAAKPKRRGAAAREIAIILVVALVVSALVRAFLFQAFYIPSGIVENTLLINDRVVVSKLGASDPKRGDIVVFKDPGGWLPPEVASDQPIARAVRRCPRAGRPRSVGGRRVRHQR